MNFAVPRPLLPRPPIPGEVWTFNAFEAHCFYEFLEEAVIEAVLAGTDIAVWEKTLGLEARKAGLRAVPPEKLAELGMSVPETVTVTQVTPTEEDRAFFEKLGLYILGLLAGVDPATKLPCEHTIYEHETAVRAWYEREIERPKGFARTRTALKGLSIVKALSGKAKLARADAAKLIQDELECLRTRLYAGDFADCDGLPPEGMQEMCATLDRAHRATLADAKISLWALLGEEYELVP